MTMNVTIVDISGGHQIPMKTINIFKTYEILHGKYEVITNFKKFIKTNATNSTRLQWSSFVRTCLRVKTIKKSVTVE